MYPVNLLNMFNDQHTNKYDLVPLAALIRSVQDMVINLKSKKKSTKNVVRKSGELYQMQFSIQKRLKDVDRLNVDFFPDRALVQYFKSVALKVYSGTGKIVGREKENKLLLVVLDDKPEEVLKIEPRYLKLLYIR